MTATVVRDDAEALLREEEHLAVPSIRAQGPAMRERYDRTLTPIFVINLCSVFGGDRAHRKPFLLIVRCRHRCRPRCFFILGSPSSRRIDFNAARVPSSSAPINREHPATSTASIVANGAQTRPSLILAVDPSGSARILYSGTPLDESRSERIDGRRFPPHPAIPKRHLDDRMQSRKRLDAGMSFCSAPKAADPLVLSRSPFARSPSRTESSLRLL